MASELGIRDSFSLQVEDVTGQKQVRAAGIPPDSTIAELVSGLVPKLELPNTDPGGRPISYHVRSDRLGRHLHFSEIAGDVLRPDDRIVLQPNIQAG